MVDKSAKRIDPFDVEALEKSLNDSATRVSTIWVSFLLFGLYLIITAGNVTPRQIFLEDPIKLPILNIDLPIVGFFFLAPIIFVTFHGYVLIQVALLARTAVAYNEAVEQSVTATSDRARVRQRLVNTLFAQIFAGSPKERSGLLGWVLRLIAWITLLIAPVCSLLLLEFKFLPYHSANTTWAHRILIALDLALVLLSWPMALDLGHATSWRQWARRWQNLPLIVSIGILSLGIILIAVLPISFPGEPHANWTRSLTTASTNHSIVLAQCKTQSWFATFLPADFDRISLPSEHFVADERFAKIDKARIDRGQEPYQAERTINLRNRDLTCSTLSDVDLRSADFSSANLSGADLSGAYLLGANFLSARLRETSFVLARLRGASFQQAEMQGIDLTVAQLQGAVFTNAQLHGATLVGANADGAIFAFAHLEGANLGNASLRFASFGSGTLLYAADMVGADLRGANLVKTSLQAADLSNALLQGADLSEALLQGTRLTNARLKLTTISKTALWRSRGARCDDAQVIDPLFETFVDARTDSETGQVVERVLATHANLEKFIKEALKDIPEGAAEAARKILLDRLDATTLPEEGQYEQVWTACAAKALPEKEFNAKLVDLVIELACSRGRDQEYWAKGMYYIWIVFKPADDAVAKQAARALLGLTDKPCPGAKEFSEETRGYIIERTIDASAD